MIQRARVSLTRTCQLEREAGQKLKQDERGFLGSIFNVGGVIDLDLDKVTVDVGSITTGTLNDGFTPGNEINLPIDWPTRPQPAKMLLLAHEATHAWQHQHGRLWPRIIATQARGVFTDVYELPHPIPSATDKGFFSYNLEQQAVIAENIAGLVLGIPRPRWIHSSRLIPANKDVEDLWEGMLSGPPR